MNMGFHSYPAYRPSEIPCLGDVSEHWQVGPIKRAFLSMDYGISESASDLGTVHLLTMGHLKDGQVTVLNNGGVDYIDPYLLLQEGDLPFNRINSQELVGKVDPFVGNDSPVTFASYLVRMRTHMSNEPEYLNMVLNDTSFISQARREAMASLHQSNLNPTRYGRILIALPTQRGATDYSPRSTEGDYRSQRHHHPCPQPNRTGGEVRHPRHR